MIVRALDPLRGVAKEVRALAGIWLAAALALGVVSLVPVSAVPRERGLPLMIYGVAAVALGAMSFGHEYGSRTFGMLLALPVSRVRLFVTKVGVLAALLAALALVGATALGAKRPVAVLAMLCGLFVAPWLTMASKRMLGGAALTMAFPALLWVGCDLMAIWMFGLAPRVNAEALAFKETVFLWGTLIWTAIGAVFSWRTFMTLEPTDGAGRAVQLFASRSVAAPASHVNRRRRSGPLWTLIGKEIRLQHVTIAMAALYLLLFGVMQATPASSYESLPGLFSALTYLYAGLVPLLAGALASAEERQLGTLGWQVLQPIAAWKQWLVKVAVVLALTAALAVALPLVLMAIVPPTATFRVSDFEISAVFALAIVSLYVSSLNSNALKALVTSIPVAILGAAFVTTVIGAIGSTAFYMVRLALRQMLGGRPLTGETGWWLNLIGIEVTALALGVMAVLVYFAYHNHFSSDHTLRTACKQAAWISVSIVAGVAIASGSFALLVAFRPF